jgi:hypothetical protein
LFFPYSNFLATEDTEITELKTKTTKTKHIRIFQSGMIVHPNVQNYFSKDPLHPSLSPAGRGVGARGPRSPRVMFDNQGKTQFVPHGTKAAVHFAEIFLPPVGTFGI